MITLYKTGLIDYSDLGLIKPVKVTEDDLRMIASSTRDVNLTDEHSEKVLSSLSNFFVEDGCLMTDEPKDVDFKGKGFSPYIKCDELVDMGDFYRMEGVHMSSIGLTTKPRNHILYNSISNPNGDDKMSDVDEQFKNLVADNRSLTEEVGSLKLQLSTVTKKLDDKDKELKEKIKSFKEKEDKLAKLTELEEKANAYDDLVKNRKQSLIKQICGDDEKKAEKYASFSVEQLQTIIEDRGNGRPQRGIPSSGTEPQDGNTPNPHNDDDDKYDWEDFETEMEAFGLS